MRTAKDWGQPCPNPRCSHYNRMHQGNVCSIAADQTQSGQRRIFCCKVCQTRFSETRDTVSFDLRTPEERVMLALKIQTRRQSGLSSCPSNMRSGLQMPISTWIIRRSNNDEKPITISFITMAELHTAQQALSRRHSPEVLYLTGVYRGVYNEGDGGAG
jgi:hypothetical protein